MRTKIIHIIAVLSAIGAVRLCAQNCPNVVHTDPRNPVNLDNSNMENQYFWFPHNGNPNSTVELITPGGTFPNVTSPFWSAPTSLMIGEIANLQNSDFYPEDGWELLKVNFGKLNNGSQRPAPLPNMPYIALYNKYSGTIRFMGMWPNASNSWQIIRLRVSLPKTKLALVN